jgi:hypothetical protein
MNAKNQCMIYLKLSQKKHPLTFVLNLYLEEQTNERMTEICFIQNIFIFQVNL